MMKTKEDYLTKLNVLFEDNHVIVVEKFINVLSQKDETNDIDMNEIIKEYLKRKYNKPGNVYLGLIHRLDRRVGGVMVFAKTSKAAQRLSEDIRNHQFDKKYLVKVIGKVTTDGSINIKLAKNKRMAIVSSDGKPSRLDYKVISYDDYSSLLLVNLITGRYNQIRVSFAHIGHPLINDYKYNSQLPQTKDDIGLWCYEITFNHPITKEKMTFRLKPQGAIW